MPRFFFDSHAGSTHQQDTIGMDLLDREAARIAALAALRDLARDEIMSGDRQDSYVNVRQEDRAIYTACMSLLGRWLD